MKINKEFEKIAEENEIENIIPIINVDAKIELDKKYEKFF